MTPIIFDTREEIYPSRHADLHGGLRHPEAARRHGGAARSAPVPVRRGRHLGPGLDVGQHQVHLRQAQADHGQEPEDRLRRHQGAGPGRGLRPELEHGAGRHRRHHRHRSGDRLAGRGGTSSSGKLGISHNSSRSGRRIRQLEHQHDAFDPVRAAAGLRRPQRPGRHVRRAHVPGHRPLRLAAGDEVGARRAPTGRTTSPPTAGRHLRRAWPWPGTATREPRGPAAGQRADQRQGLRLPVLQDDRGQAVRSAGRVLGLRSLPFRQRAVEEGHPLGAEEHVQPQRARRNSRWARRPAGRRAACRTGRRCGGGLIGGPPGGRTTTQGAHPLCDRPGS